VVWGLHEWWWLYGRGGVVGVDLENLWKRKEDWLEGRPEEMGMDVI
jgi:hypothetical protein